LPVAIQTSLYWGYTPRYLRACHRRYGDAFTVRAFPAGTRVFLADPKDIKTVFTADPEVFRAGEANAVLKPVMGSRSVLLIDGEEHTAQRRRMLPAFHGDREEGLPAYIEASSERNAALYERRGFRLIRELRAGGCSPLRLMLSPPTLSAVQA
jgi:cytochrome P450 family 135